ncbi:MAG: alpha/beta hydrolase [Eubacteriales bacterium]|nr:alpha/beta hydrolase [Eubacteriales bacterium]
MAVRKEFHFLSSDGKTRLRAVCWMPETGRPRGVVQITHGMVEFMERYEEFAEYMTGCGYVVAGHDQLGHGNSVSSEREYGFFAEKEPGSCLVRDIHRLRRILEREYPGLPRFMLGHSMGSFLTRRYITRYGGGLSGVVLTGTGCIPGAAAAAGLVLVRLVSAVYGGYYRSRLVERLIFSGGYRQYDMSGKNPEKSWLTRDVQKVSEYRSDPRSRFSFTMNGYRGLLETVLCAGRLSYMRRIPSGLPVLLLSGSGDPLGGFGRGVLKVKRLLQKAGVEQVECKIYRGCRHEVLNELNRNEVFGDIAGFFRSCAVPDNNNTKEYSDAGI